MGKRKNEKMSFKIFKEFIETDKWWDRYWYCMACVLTAENEHVGGKESIS